MKKYKFKKNLYEVIGLINYSNYKFSFIYFKIGIILFLFFLKNIKVNKRNIPLDLYETNIFNKIKEKLKKYKCSVMWANQPQFLNGVIRKFKPKKILEIGVLKGGSSIIILNAIKDIKNSYLYSIDLRSDNIIGRCVKNYFPYLKNKWYLFQGNIAANFMEEIGKDIDFAFFDSSHFEPGEILDFLMVLPFLKEGAIVGFHDIGQQINNIKGLNSRNEWAPYIIFNLIRGKKYLPSGSNILTHDIGAIKLEKYQFKYYHDYFRALGGQWQYLPEYKHLNLCLNYFKKFYDNNCIIMFKEAVKFNEKFVKKNPKEDFYSTKKHLKRKRYI